MSVPGCFYSRWGRKSAPRWGCFIKRLQLDEQTVINSSDSSDEGESENEKNNFYIFFWHVLTDIRSVFCFFNNPLVFPVGRGK